MIPIGAATRIGWLYIPDLLAPFTGEEYQKRKSDKINPFTDCKKK